MTGQLFDLTAKTQIAFGGEQVLDQQSHHWLELQIHLAEQGGGRGALRQSSLSSGDLPVEK